VQAVALIVAAPLAFAGRLSGCSWHCQPNVQILLQAGLEAVDTRALSIFPGEGKDFLLPAWFPSSALLVRWRPRISCDNITRRFQARAGQYASANWSS